MKFQGSILHCSNDLYPVNWRHWLLRKVSLLDTNSCYDLHSLCAIISCFCDGTRGKRPSFDDLIAQSRPPDVSSLSIA